MEVIFAANRPSPGLDPAGGLRSVTGIFLSTGSGDDLARRDSKIRFRRPYLPGVGHLPVLDGHVVADWICA